MSLLFPTLQAQPDEGADIAYTPAPVAQACVAWLAQHDLVGRWWDPCCGGGAFAHALSPLAPGHATELDPKATSVVDGLAVHGDCLQGPPPGCEPILITTNPPFSIATQILRMAMAVPTCQTIALLLLQGWIVPDGLGLERRKEIVWGPQAHFWWQAPIYPRIPFEGPGRSGTKTDMREYAMVVWRRNPSGGWGWNKVPAFISRIEWR